MALSPDIYNALNLIPTSPQSRQGQETLSSSPVQLFPPELENMIRALHDDSHIPVALISNVALAAASLACQGLVDVIQPHTNTPEPCSLYLLTVADSGEGKTTINKLIMKPFYDFASEMKREYTARMADYKREHKIWKVVQQGLDSNLRQAIKKGYSGEHEIGLSEEHARKEPSSPVRPAFIYEDVSLKALVEGLSEHPDAGFLSDEAITFFKSYLKNHPGLLNKAWDGEPYDFRRADGEIYEIRPSLTFSLMAQPGIFMDYLKKHGDTARSSGFLSRFLFAWIDRTDGHRNRRAISDRTKYSLNVFYEKVSVLLEKQKRNFYGPALQKKTLRLTPEALTLWQNKITETENRLAPGHEWEHIRDIASKSGANTLRMAALFQYMQDVDAEFIQPDIMACSLGIMDWYLKQADKVFYPISEKYQFERDVRELYSWIKNRFAPNNWTPFAKNDIEKRGPGRLRRTDKLDPVLNQLICQKLIGIVQASNHSARYISPQYPDGSFGAPPVPLYNNTFRVDKSWQNTAGRSAPVDLSDL